MHYTAMDCLPYTMLSICHQSSLSSDEICQITHELNEKSESALRTCFIVHWMQLQFLGRAINHINLQLMIAIYAMNYKIMCTHCPLEVWTKSVTNVDVAGQTQFSANMAYLNSSSHTTWSD